jgi:hypothetical protein
MLVKEGTRRHRLSPEVLRLLRNQQATRQADSQSLWETRLLPSDRSNLRQEGHLEALSLAHRRSSQARRLLSVVLSYPYLQAGLASWSEAAILSPSTRRGPLHLVTQF